MNALLLLLLICVPQPPQAPSIVADWSMQWGGMSGTMDFNLDGTWTSDVWQEGYWYQENGIIYMGRGQTLWGMRVTDWKAGTLDGWRCNGDEVTDKVSVKIRQRIE